MNYQMVYSLFFQDKTALFYSDADLVINQSYPIAIPEKCY